MHSESHHFTLMISSHLHTLTEVTFPFTSCSLCMPLANVIMCYAVKFTQFQFTYHQTCQKKKHFLDELPGWWRVAYCKSGPW